MRFAALLRIALRIALHAALLVPLPGLFGAVSIDVAGEWAETPSATREFAYAKRHLSQSFDGYGQTDVFATAFGVVALSHFAAGLMNVYVAEPDRTGELVPLLDELARRATDRRTAPSDLVLGDRLARTDPFDDHNLYLSHVAIVLGVRRLVACAPPRETCTVTPADDALHEAIVTHLQARSLGGDGIARSYPDSDRWPADQTVTLLALRLYDEAHGTHTLTDPLDRFLSMMREHTDPETGLFHSAVTAIDYATTPRGCAASWSALYLAQVEPEVAAEQYAHYRKAMAADVLGFGGFREWPRGRERGADVDSGPIVLGAGIAASGLGLGPARLFGDAEQYATIRRSALTFGAPSWIPSHGYVTAPVLGEAILFHGRTARPWFRPAPDAVPATPTLSATPAPSKASFSLVSLFLLVGYLAFVGDRVRRLVRRLRRPTTKDQR